MATILITGGTGMIGTALTNALVEKGYSVIILTRDPSKYTPASPLITYAAWDTARQSISAEAISAADHIIHLAGENVGERRWTKKRKKAIVDSRVKSGVLLIRAMKENVNHIRTVVTASAIGWYGPDPVVPNPDRFREDAPAANDFLGTTTKQWEAAIEPAKAMGKRIVKIRTGLVLSPAGGMLDEFRKPLRFGIATILGGGKQVLSWIHLTDLIRIYILAIENNQLEGPYNAVAPKPATNKELALTLARIRKGNFFIPVYVPAFALKLALGELSVEVLKSTTVSCDKIHVAGFTFVFPSLQPALADTR